jgi:hypothetical protein
MRLEDAVREALRRRAAAVTVKEGAWERFNGGRSIGGPRREDAPRRRRAAIALLAAGLVVVPFTAVWLSFRSGERSETGTSPPPPSVAPSAVAPGPGLGDRLHAGSSLLAIDGAAFDDVWAVGETHGDQRVEYHSLVEHWDGGVWHVVPTPDIGRLVEIDVNAADDVWVLGQQALLHFDGVHWTILNIPRSPGGGPTSMSSSGSDDVWLAGTRPGPMIGRNSRGLSSLVVHWDGSSWSQADTPNPGSRDNYLEGIVALSPDDVWAAGYLVDRRGPDGQVLTMHWDGRSWSVVPAPNPSSTLNVIWGMGSAGSSIWALGHFQSEGHLRALILHWDGVSWDQVRPEGSSLWSATSASGTSASDAWIGGGWPSSNVAVAHCIGADCSVVLGPELDGRSSGTAVYSGSADDVWVVGYRTGIDGTSPFLRHWDGSRWRDVPTPVDE